jgi:glycosyltransferase involved in cell wall biosynthesis
MATSTPDGLDIAGPAQPAVSVVIPTYNRALLLKRAVESVLRQTERDFELIVVDDASSDDTPAVMRAISDDRLRCVRHEQNQGVGGSYAAGIALARGPLIAIHDHDDVARPEWLERLTTACRCDPGVGMAWGWIRAHDRGGDASSVMYRDPFGAGPRELLPTMLTWTPGTSGLVVRRAVFDEIGFIDPQAGPLADLEFAARFALSEMYRVEIVPEVLVDIYPQSDSASRVITEPYLVALKHLVARHEAALARYPCAYADYLYRIGRASEILGQTGVDHLYAKAARYCPGDPKYRLYSLARRYRLTTSWRAVSRCRLGVRRWRQRRKHGPSS